MRILTLHVDYIKFKPTRKALKEAEEVEKKEVSVKNCLAVLASIERGDETNKEIIVKKLVEHVKDRAKQVKTKTIVLYPYAHLSSKLASPQDATAILKEASKALSKNFEVVSAPFGWYKEFELKCKGHPLAELSASISADETPVMEEVKGNVGVVKEEKITKHALDMKLKRFGKQTAIEKEKLSENDHRILGPKLDLFSFHEVAPGMVFWHDKGRVLWNQLLRLWRKRHEKAGYREISTPQLLDKNVWEISGHLEHYNESMFFTKIEGRDFALKPMNCPGAILLFKSAMRSYRDLPLRLAELGVVSRNELSGVLAGLFRLRVFTQDDAHIFVMPDQLEKEIAAIIELVNFFYKMFDFQYTVELSTRPEKFLGTKEQWDYTEKALENALKKAKTEYKINKGDGAFYGP
ncbi:MAG: threonyl-tRNA synthetase editing domain-containing protein, partial [Nanoarchaeota archaeon]